MTGALDSRLGTIGCLPAPVASARRFTPSTPPLIIPAELMLASSMRQACARVDLGRHCQCLLLQPSVLR